MGSLNNSCSNTNMKRRKNFSLERRPRMLKDFLTDDSNSCSTTGFKSFPKTKPCNNSSTVKNIIDDSTRNARNLLRSRSKGAASTTISAIQALVKAFKGIPFAAAKSPSFILPRSLSRRLSKKISEAVKKESHEIKPRVVTVKDIIRWRSFGDIVEEEFAPLDSAASPQNYTVTRTATASTATTPHGSNASSWCDSDFTSEYLPDEYGENEIEIGKKYLPCVGGEDSMKATRTVYTTVFCKADQEEKQQQSPVSVMDFEFDEDEETNSSFNRTLATMERTKQKLMQNIRRFESLAKMESINLDKWMSMDENPKSESENDEDEEKETETNYQKEQKESDEVEEKAWQLLNHVRDTTLLGSNTKNVDEVLLLDFFRDELGIKRNQNRSFELYSEILNRAEDWINGEKKLWVGWEEENKREAYVVDMNRGGMWAKFEEEQEELALVIEHEMVGVLVDELLLDLIFP